MTPTPTIVFFFPFSFFLCVDLSLKDYARQIDFDAFLSRRLSTPSFTPTPLFLVVFRRAFFLSRPRLLQDSLDAFPFSTPLFLVAFLTPTPSLLDAFLPTPSFLDAFLPTPTPSLSRRLPYFLSLSFLFDAFLSRRLPYSDALTPSFLVASLSRCLSTPTLAFFFPFSFFLCVSTAVA